MRQSQLQDDDGIRSVRNALGFILVLGGAMMGVWIFLKVVAIFKNPAELGAFDQLLPVKEVMLQLAKAKGGPLALPPELLKLALYGIAGMLLFAAAGVSGGFVSAGVKLLLAGGVKLDKKLG